MLFNSIDFILFFPIVTLLYFIIPKKLRALFLLGCSFYFYMCWKAKYIVLIGFSILVTYLGGILIEYFDKRQKPFQKSLVLYSTLLSNLAILFLFKYYNFFAENLAAVTHNQLMLPLLRFALPVGISFYTFQALGYTIDVYQKVLPAEKNPIIYALFISFYPQLVAGPIERSTNLMPQIKQGTSFSYENMRQGLLLMGWGMFQKLVIADRLALFVDGVYAAYTQVNGIFLLAATILFAFQIYCDFASYSNIARGAAKVMGYELMVNFDAPYLSRSFAEYWSRWHISLSTWFQDYLFEPIVWHAKNKKVASYVAVLTVFAVSGLWHGASWTFLLWGALHAFFRMGEMFLRRPKKKLYKKLHISVKSKWFQAVQTVFVFLCVCLTYIFFRSNTVSQAFSVLGSILTNTNPSLLFTSQFFSFGLDVKDAVVALLAMLVLVISDVLIYRRKDIYHTITRQPRPIRWIIYWILLFSIVIFGVYGPEYSVAPFIYFQF